MPSMKSRFFLRSAIFKKKDKNMCCAKNKADTKPCWPGFGKKGMAMIEMIPVMLMMFILMGASLGSWGIVHTATLHSIAARNYAFFVFNNRSDLSYFRDDQNPSRKTYYRTDARSNQHFMTGKRFHFIAKQKSSSSPPEAQVITRRVAFDKTVQYYNTNPPSPPNLLTPNERQNLMLDRRNYDQSRSGGKKAIQVWIKVGYGICLDAGCGD